MKHLAVLLICLGLLAGCDSDPMSDAGPGADGSADVDAGQSGDGGVFDGGGTDGGMTDAGAGPRTSAQITLVRGTPAGAISPALPIEDATVTYVRDAAGDDPAGFFVQGEAAGPAIFVAIDASALTPPPVAGDVVRFDVSGTARVSEQMRVLTIEGYARQSQGADVNALVQDLTNANDAAQAEPYESELVTIVGTVEGTPASGGPGHLRMRLVTSMVDDPNLAFRAPDAVFASSQVADGCEIEVGPSPVWRFQSTNQIQAYVAGDLTVRSCPPPEVVSAVAMDPTHVVVTFSQAIDPATVQASDFTFAGGSPTLTASAASVMGDEITVTTNTMGDGQTYTVIVSGLNDTLGTPIGSTNSASFTGLGAGVPSLIISEYLENTRETRVLEITNVGTVTTMASDCQILIYANGNTTANAPRALPAIAAGDSLVVCHNLAPMGISSRCDLIDTAAVSFSGNDALEIVCGGSLQDSFGQVGVDPGRNGWGAAPTTTVDATLRRTCSVGVGDRNSGDVFDPSLQWAGFPVDTLGDLGRHCP